MEAFTEHLMSNQCPLCEYVMSTRKSLRHHLIFQHVLRDTGALHLLLGASKANADECTLVRQLLSAPELLWKRGPLRVSACLFSEHSRNKVRLHCFYRRNHFQLQNFLKRAFRRRRKKNPNGNSVPLLLLLQQNWKRTQQFLRNLSPRRKRRRGKGCAFS